ncbi:MAG: Mu-like prophage protein Com [Parcubacteria group bacterium ADurb.Bin216]|jgi:phage FluMu protein Com|nr:MAG: Mu-like prophage protein Com [Parcubacteria group bacterium ADurb.Bin216]
MDNLKEMRCPECNKLLFKADSEGSAVEIKCKNCKNITKIDVSDSRILTVNDREYSYERRFPRKDY